MYNNGFVVAVVLGVVALLMPMLWIGWWLLADLGERVSGTHGEPTYETSETTFRRAA